MSDNGQPNLSGATTLRARDYIVTVAEIPPNECDRLREVNVQFTAAALVIDPHDNLHVVKGGESVAVYAAGKWRGWRVSHFNPSVVR